MFVEGYSAQMVLQNSSLPHPSRRFRKVHFHCGASCCFQEPEPYVPDAPEGAEDDEAGEVLAIMDSQPDGELCEEECEETQIEGDPPVEAPQYQPMDIDQAEIDAWTDRQADEPSPYLGGEDDAHLDHSHSKVEVDGEVANGEKALGSEDVKGDVKREDKKENLFPSVADEEARIRALEKQLANVRALQQALHLGVTVLRGFPGNEPFC